MCLILFAGDAHPDYRLILVSNRDEFHARPAAPLHIWDDPPGLRGGRDMSAGGAWLAAGSDGRWGAVTNFRGPPESPSPPKSRGRLVVDFLQSAQSPADFIRGLVSRSERFAGYNLLLGDEHGIWWTSNRAQPANPIVKVEPGVHGLSNELLDTPWPKVVHGRKGLTELVDSDEVSSDALFRLIRIDTPAPDSELPSTDVPSDLERALSAAFVRTPEYGTRASTVLLISTDGATTMIERRFDPDGNLTDEHQLSW